MALVPRQDKRIITVSVDGVDLGSFMTRAGGKLDSEDLKTRPGGAQQQISLGGPKSRENVTVTTLYTETIQAKKPWIESRVGSGVMKVADQPLDADDNAAGRSDVYTGTFKAFTPPDGDVNANETALCEFELSANV